MKESHPDDGDDKRFKCGKKGYFRKDYFQVKKNKFFLLKIKRRTRHSWRGTTMNQKQILTLTMKWHICPLLDSKTTTCLERGIFKLFLKYFFDMLSLQDKIIKLKQKMHIKKRQLRELWMRWITRCKKITALWKTNFSLIS